MGKITKLNQKESRELKKLWIEKDVRWCEYPDPHNCNFGFYPTNAHRHKKVWYRGKPDELRWSYNQVIRLCIHSHQATEFDREATEELFLKLRGKDD